MARRGIDRAGPREHAGSNQHHTARRYKRFRERERRCRDRRIQVVLSARGESDVYPGMIVVRITLGGHHALGVVDREAIVGVSRPLMRGTMVRLAVRERQRRGGEPHDER